jgi:hypothetical protein
MNDETSNTELVGISAPNVPTGSHMFGVSIRGWLAVLAITTVCVCNVMKIEVMEPLYTLSVAIIAFYYGQNVKMPSRV